MEAYFEVPLIVLLCEVEGAEDGVFDVDGLLPSAFGDPGPTQLGLGPWETMEDEPGDGSRIVPIIPAARDST
jgi:hypothetical protein